MLDLFAVFIGRINNIISVQPLTLAEIWGDGWHSLSEEEQGEVAAFALSLAAEDGRILRGDDVENDDITANRYSVNPHLLRPYAALEAQDKED